MENASKALIMAGGMLIGIMVLSLSLYLFVTFAQGAARVQNSIREDQIAQFNSRFNDLIDAEGITIYDIVSIASFARDYNTSNEIPDTNTQDYIKVKLTGMTSIRWFGLCSFGKM